MDSTERGALSLRQPSRIRPAPEVDLAPIFLSFPRKSECRDSQMIISETSIYSHAFSVTSGFGYGVSCLLNETSHVDLNTLHVDILAGAMEQERIVSTGSRLAQSQLTPFLGTFSGCSTAFHQPGDTNVQVACQANDVRTTIHCKLPLVEV